VVEKPPPASVVTSAMWLASHITRRLWEGGRLDPEKRKGESGETVPVSTETVGVGVGVGVGV
jgi:hypothetical protein